VKDVLSKSLGSSNAVNVVKATLDALKQLRPQDEIYRVRGLSRPAAAASLREDATAPHAGVS
jgi:small subunit ribosomal protein S5